MTLAYLAELGATVDAAGSFAWLRFSSGTGYAHPSAPGYYAPRILQPANFRRDLFAEGKIGGASRPGFGELVLINVDGGLDPLIGYGFAGLPFVLKLGDEGQPYDSFVTVLAGTLEQPSFSWTDVRLRVRDRQALFDQPLQTNRYGGSNSLPNGLDGVAGDLAGRPKPLVFGKVRNIAPPCVNTARLIFQVNDGAVASIDQVYDRGLALTAGSVYTSQADMETNAPAAGYFRAWLAGGYVRLGSSPAGTVTADVTEGASSADRAAGAIVDRIVTGPGGLSAGDLVTADFTALAAAVPATVGLWVGDDQTIARSLDLLADTIGGWWGFDRFGQFRLQRIVGPAATPALTFRNFARAAAAGLTDADIVTIDRVPTNDPGRGVPSWRLTLGFARNWTVQASDLAGAVAADRREWLKAACRFVAVEDATVQNRYPTSPEIWFGPSGDGRTAMGEASLFDDETDATTEAARRFALFSVRRDRLKLKVRLEPDLIGALDLGSTVAVDLPRFGFAGGAHFIVTGMEYDAAGRLCDLELWG